MAPLFIAVGAAVGVAAIIMISVALAHFRRQRRDRRADDLPKPGQPLAPPEPGVRLKPLAPPAPPAAAPQTSAPPGSPPPVPFSPPGYAAPAAEPEPDAEQDVYFYPRDIPDLDPGPGDDPDTDSDTAADPHTDTAADPDTGAGDFAVARGLEGWMSFEREWSAPEPPPPPAGEFPGPAAPSRYANATIASQQGQPWPPDQPLTPGGLLLLRLSIGPLAPDQQVADPVPFPDEQLPDGDLIIDVSVSSTTFAVGRDLAATPAEHSAEAQFLLPGDGSPALTDDGGTDLTFVLLVPADPGQARLRIGYYYRGAVVQSQLLTAEIGTGPWSLVTDYTIAAALPAAAAIPARPRISVMINGDTGHQIYVRSRAGTGGELTTTPLELPLALGDRVRDFRRVLASEPIAPVSAQRSRAQLITTLRTLAPLGWQLYSAIFPGLTDTLLQLDDQPGPAVLHVARPAGSGLSVPWALLYTTYISSRYGPGYQQVPLCPLVSEWDGRSPLAGLAGLAGGQQTACPRAADVPHGEDLLCPFGFLGLRHDIEQLSSTQRPVVSITAAAGSRMVVAQTAQVDQRALDQHLAGLAKTVAARLPGVQLRQAATSARLRELICHDLPLVYFYCHGQRPTPASHETYLAIGQGEAFTAADFAGWVMAAYRTQRLRVWDQIRPLVFINACHSVELDPQALFSYVSAFVTGANAAGVIGTEVKVSQPLAMEFAQLFFDELLTSGATVASAMRRARLAFLARGNLFGLMYTPYCWADLAVTS